MTDVAELGWRSNTKPLKDSADQLRRIRDEGRGAAGANDEYNSSTGRAASGTDRLTGRLERLGGFMGSLKNQIIGFGATMVAAFGFQAVIGDALAFSQRLGEVSTIAEGDMAAIEAAARDMGREFGSGATAQLDAFYNAISAGGTAANTTAKAIDLVNQANRIAVGGATSAATAVDILTASVNAYASSGLTAADAGDILFVGALAGATSIDELATSLGRVIPSATALNVPLETLVAAVASLTTVGQSTDTAVTGIGQALAQILSPSADAVQMAAQLGIEFNSTALKAKGFAQFMRDVTNAANGNQDALATLFGSVQAMRAVFAFAGDAGDTFNDVLLQMENRAGATDRAFDLMADGLNARWNVVMGQVKGIALDFGTFLLNVLVPALELIANNIGIVSAALLVLAARFAAPALAALGGMIVTWIAGFEAWAMGIARASGSMQLLSARTIALNGAMSILRGTMAFLGGPIGIALLAVAGTVALFSSNAQAANEQMSAHEAIVKAVGDAYVAARGDAAGLTEEILRQNELSLAAIVENRDNMRDALADNESELVWWLGYLDDLRTNLTGVINISQQNKDWISSIINQIDGLASKSTTVDEFVASMSNIGVAAFAAAEAGDEWSENIVTVTSDLTTLAQKIAEGTITVEDAERAVRAATGTLTDADRAYYALGVSADGAAAGVAGVGNAAGGSVGNLQAATAAANQLATALRTLNAIGMPNLTDRQAALAAYSSANQATDNQAAARGMTTEDMLNDNDYLAQQQANWQRYQEALTRISTEEAATRATEVAAIEREAFIGGLEGRERAIEEENLRYQDQMAALLAINGTAEDYNRITAAHSQMLANIDQQYADIADTVGGGGGGSVVDSIDKATEAAKELAETVGKIGEDMRKGVVDAFKGFFQDLYAGKGLLESFSNALDKIVGKMFDLWVDNIFSGFLAKPMGGGGPIIGFIKKLIGLESGGYTGDGGRKEVAGVVHGQEFVLNAQATQKFRPILEAMNDNNASLVDRLMGFRAMKSSFMASLFGGGGLGGMRPMAPANGNGRAPSVTVINNTGTEASASVEQDSNGDLIITLDKAFEMLANKPGSRTNKALKNANALGGR